MRRWQLLDSLNLDEKIVVITGGGTGLGLEMGRDLARAGANIVLAGRRPEPIEQAAEEFRGMGLKSISIPTDVTDSTQVNNLFNQTLESFGKVDVLINNAGGGSGNKPIWEITDQEWHDGIDKNLTGAFYCCRAILRHMVEQESGKIINISSGQGLRGQRGSFMYGCSKGGVIQLTRVIAATYGPMGITSNCIVPGMIPIQNETQPKEPNKRLNFLPMGRAGTPQEMAPLATFLASDASNYMNGEMLYCDGGALAGGAAITGYSRNIQLDY